MLTPLYCAQEPSAVERSRRRAVLVRQSAATNSTLTARDMDSSDSEGEGEVGGGYSESPSVIIAGQRPLRQHSPGKNSIHMHHDEARRAFAILYGK